MSAVFLNIEKLLAGQDREAPFQQTALMLLRAKVIDRERSRRAYPFSFPLFFGYVTSHNGGM